MTTTYTFDVVATLDGYGSYDEHGDWGGFWGKQGPELIDHRLAQYEADQRLVLGANTFRQFQQMLGSNPDLSGLDALNARMVSMPTTVVSSTLEGPLAWPDATLVSGDAVEVVARLKEESDVPLRSHGSLAMNRALMAAGLADRDIQELIYRPTLHG
jgi:dihydrofolate reductase